MTGRERASGGTHTCRCKETHTHTHAWPRSRQTDTMRKQKTHLSTYAHTDSPPTKCQSMVRIPSLLDTQSIRASYEDCVIHYSVSCSHEGSMGGMWGLLNIKTCPWMKVWFHHNVFSPIIKPVCSRIMSCFGADQRGVCVCLCLYGHANVGKCVCKGETEM